VDRQTQSRPDIDTVAELRRDSGHCIARVAGGVQRAETCRAERSPADPVTPPPELQVHSVFRVAAERQRRVHAMNIEAAEDFPADAALDWKLRANPAQTASATLFTSDLLNSLTAQCFYRGFVPFRRPIAKLGSNRPEQATSTRSGPDCPGSRAAGPVRAPGPAGAMPTPAACVQQGSRAPSFRRRLEN
jgi:hypothetical protein